MEMNDDKKLDQLIGKSIRLVSLNAPSEGFEESILEKIQAVEIKNKALNKPLISKLTWVFLGAGFVSLMVYLIATLDTEQSLWFKDFNYTNVFANRFFETFDAIQFGSTLFYSVICFFSMLVIQLPFLKHYFDKQLKY